MSYYGFCVTQQGGELLAKLVAGSTLSLLYVMAGDGEVPDDCVPRTMTALANPVLKGTSTTPIVNDATVSMVLEFNSGDLTESFYLREFGIFADDPDEGTILFAYGTLGDYAQYMCAASDTGVDIRRFPVSLTIGEGVEVSVDWSELAWMTAEDVKIYITAYILPEIEDLIDEKIAAHNTDGDAHPELLAQVQELAAMVELLKLQMNTGTASDCSFSLSFATLDDAVVTGVWNESAARIEF